MQYNISAQFYERYGDVQAFAASKSAQDLDASALNKLFNQYMKLYGIYDLILAVDLNGNLVSSNSILADDSKLQTDAINSFNFKNEPWFKAAIEGKFTEDIINGLVGTFVEDPHFDPIVEKVTGKKS